MDKYWRWFLIIEVQVILVAMIFFALNADKQKVANRIQAKRIIELEEMIFDDQLSKIKSTDVIIGDSEAPIEMIMYTRFDCSICHEFFNENYLLLKEEFIESGKLKLVVKNLVHESKDRNLLLSAKLNEIYNTRDFDLFQKTELIDSILIHGMKLNYSEIQLNDPSGDLKKKLLSEARLYRSYGIRSTPTFFINGTKVIGNRKFDRFRSLLKSEL